MEHFKIIETMYIANIFAIQNPYYLTFDFLSGCTFYHLGPFSLAGLHIAIQS